MRTIFQALMATVAAVLLAACGGSSDVCYSGPGGQGSCDAEEATTATSLTIQLSKTSVTNSGTDTVEAVATAATAGGQTVAGVPVTFAVDGGATFTASGAETDTDGRVAAVVSVGPDRSNRTITVTATSGDLSATATFVVTGTTLTSTANPAVVAPSSAGNQVLFLLQDAAGNAMANQAINVVAGPAGTADGVTDSNGAYTFEYTAPATTGTLSIIAKAGGVERTQDVLVQTTSSVPPAKADPASATVAANPSVVAPNVDDSTSNRTEIRALFIDAGNRAISNMRVRFSVNGYGTFSTGDSIVYSDSNGRAVTSFIPGARTSPKDGVTITACYSKVDFAKCTDAGVQSITTSLTIAADPLSITIGTDNLIIVGDLTYAQRFVVTAVDIAGRAKANVEITPSIDLQYYFKGIYVWDGEQWIQRGCDDASCTPPTNNIVYGCQNEDIDRTGFYQEAQDINLNGQIDPRKSDVVISPVSIKTDANGRAVLQIEYPKNLGSWLQYRILVSAGVNGTEGRTSWTDVLGVPITDVKAEGEPAFVRSAYGIVTVTATPSIQPARGPVTPCYNAD